MCGNMGDGGPDACGHEHCVHEENGGTCECDEAYELVLLVNGSVRGQGM